MLVPPSRSTPKYRRCMHGYARLTAGSATVALAIWPTFSAAGEFATGIPDFSLRWDNTVKYSAADRLKKQSAVLTAASANPNNPNQDDGDRNFNKGLISNRLDLFSELDVGYKNFGGRISGAAWYDTVYTRSNDNPGFAGGAYPNQTSVPANEFTHATRRIHGRGGEVLDAFVYGNFAISDESQFSLKIGRHAMTWGETLFFGANGLAGGMMPVDAVKLISVPNTQFKEAIRPVPMISGQWQVTSDTALAAYYQFAWAKSRIPAVGSYFSASDILPDGAEQVLTTGPNSPFLNNAPRLADLTPKKSGQGGLQLRTHVNDYDLGAYFIRYHDKTPQPVVSIGHAAVAYVPVVGCPIPGSVLTGTSCTYPGPVNYRLVYEQGITSFGLSGNRTFGDLNLGVEASMRRNQPLTSGISGDTSALTHSAPTDNSSNPGFPLARTLHLNASTIWSIPRSDFLRESAFAGEIGWNRVQKVTHNAYQVDPNSTRSAIAFRGVFSNTYRQVLAGTDLTPNLGLGWAPKGSRSAITTTTLPQNGNGDLTLGTDVVYLDVWRASIAVTHYFGSQGGVQTPGAGGTNPLSYKQSLGDRDFVAASLRRTF